jgi:hypothetical protein
MKARLLTGIDALASRDATSNPEIIARVQAPAVLPNEVKANLAGCFVIGNATGSLAKSGSRSSSCRFPASISMNIRSSINRSKASSSMPTARRACQARW